MICLPSDQSVNTRVFERLLDYGNLTTSYKLFWFNGIFQEIIAGNKSVSFRRIVCRMICAAWYPVVQYRLNLGIWDKLYDTVIFIQRKYGISPNEKQEVLLDFLDKLNDSEIEKLIINLYKYAPYRLIAPFYENELAGLKDGFKNTRIYELSRLDNKAIYKIRGGENEIEINDNRFNYIYCNQNIIYGWMNFKLIYFLQKKNPNVPAIPFKLNPPYQRDLSKAKRFWNEVKQYAQLKDIYTNEAFTKENFSRYGELSIDHFIPWSFVLHDELWNLVPTFKNINSSKSDRLPKKEAYLNEFCEVQFSAFQVIRRNKAMSKLLEDYMHLNASLVYDVKNNAKGMTKDSFVNSLKDTIMPLYQIAYNQGYGVWEVKYKQHEIIRNKKSVL